MQLNITIHVFLDKFIDA